MVFPQRCPILLLQQTTSCNPLYKWITCIFATSAVANFLLGGLTVFEDTQHRSLEAWATAVGPQETPLLCKCIRGSSEELLYTLQPLLCYTPLSEANLRPSTLPFRGQMCSLWTCWLRDKAVSVLKYLVQNDTGILASWNKGEGRSRMSTEEL